MASYNVHVSSMPSVHVADLPPVEVDVVDMPSVDVGALPDLTISEIGAVGPVTLAGIPDRYTVAISALPDLNVRVKEIPSVRAHLPVNLRLGLSLLGIEVAALHLCGEVQVITEPYVRNPCECGVPPRARPSDSRPPAAVLLLREQQ